MSRLRVAVIGGGTSCEHDVSVASAGAVATALAPAHDVIGLTIGRDGTWFDATGEPLATSVAASLAAAVTIISSADVVMPAVHGPVGEDGTLAALFDLAGIAYVGSGVRGGAMAMDKWATKLVARELGITTARSTLVTSARRTLVYDQPVVVKPVAAGSSHGVTLVASAEALQPAIDHALGLDDRVLVEELLVGLEIDVAVLERADGGRFVGPALEIVVGDGLFDTERKYDGSADFRVPADLDEALRKEIEVAALELFDALGCAGVARFDFFVTSKGVVLNEVNTMPGLTAESQVPRMFAAAGLPYAALLDELVRGAPSRRGVQGSKSDSE